MHVVLGASGGIGGAVVRELAARGYPTRAVGRSLPRDLPAGMYGPVDGALREDTPLHPVGRKGRTRAEMARRLLERHAAGEVEVVIGRASDYCGPGGLQSTAGKTVSEPALAGKRARWVGRLDVPHTLHYLGDVARGLVTLGEREEARGQVWHLPRGRAAYGKAVPRARIRCGWNAAADRPSLPRHDPPRRRLLAAHP